MTGRKKSILLLVLILLLALTFGCGTKKETATEQPKAEAPKEEGPKIALLLASFTGNTYLSQAYGFLDEAEKMGIPKPILLAAGGYDKIDVQVKQVEDMIADKVDAIVIAPLSIEGLTPVVDRAVDKGIAVLEFGQETKSQKVKARIRSNQEEIGRRLGKAIGESLQGKGNVVMFNGPTGASWSQLETKGFKDVVTADYPDLKILAEKWTVYDAGVAMNTMNDLLQAFPQIDYIYTSYDTYAEGAARALEVAGKKGKIRMATASLTPTTFQMLKEGTLDYVVGTGLVDEGRMAVQTALKMIKGEEVPPLQWAPMTDYWAKDIKANPDAVDKTKEYYPEGWTLPQ